MSQDKYLQIDPKRCKACELCLGVCPKHCLELSDERNAAGYPMIRLSAPSLCIACGTCALMCPEPQCLVLVARG